MKTSAIRLGAAALALTTALGVAAGSASASEKTIGAVGPPRVVATVEGPDIARGDHNTRVGRYGEVRVRPAVRSSQYASRGRTPLLPRQSASYGGYNVQPGH